MTPANIHLIAGARPNFMKIAPLYHALVKEPWCAPVIVHTGQHYDANMSAAFFRDLDLPDPHHSLGIGSGTHSEQTAGVMVAYEALCMAQRPDWTIVVGDVNSTMACTLAAKKLHIRVAHLEAGLRSFDLSMPEEVNRLVTDALCDFLWTPSPDADANLQREGVPADRIERAGNMMIDALEMMRPRIVAVRMAERLGQAGQYGLVTLHRPSNVDDPAKLAAIAEALIAISARLPLVFPIHPRTSARLRAAGLLERLQANAAIRLLEPLGYVDFMSLLIGAAVAITDSGGIQEESTYLGIPCLTLRENTERPITVAQGTNKLMRIEGLQTEVERVMTGRRDGHRCPDLWDGRTAGRVVRSLHDALDRKAR